MDALIAGQLRKEGVSMHAIRSAHSVLKRDLHTDHPFAHSDIYTDGKRVFVDVAETIGDSTLSEVVSRQHFFPKVRDRLTHIEYSDSSRLAERWNIANGVLIDPMIGFGKPVVKGTGVTTHVVFRSHRANRSNTDLVAELYGLTPAGVVSAVNFEMAYSIRNAA